MLLVGFSNEIVVSDVALGLSVVKNREHSMVGDVVLVHKLTSAFSVGEHVVVWIKMHLSPRWHCSHY